MQCQCGVDAVISMLCVLKMDAADQLSYAMHSDCMYSRVMLSGRVQGNHC